MLPIALSMLILTSCDACISPTKVAGKIEIDFREESKKELQERIVGGEPYEGLPAVGALTRNGNAHCTATLISSKRAITAAHCVKDIPARQLRFVANPDIKKALQGETFAVSSTKMHPKASISSSAIINDVAYVELEHDTYIEPMQMSQSAVKVGDDIFLVGYGVESGFSQQGAGIKRAAYSRISQVERDKFLYGNSMTNTCNGDSGGPAFIRAAGGFKIAGVTSYGDYYCSQYGADMRVDHYYNFFSEGLDLGGISTAGNECNGVPDTGVCEDGKLKTCEHLVYEERDCTKLFFGKCKLNKNTGKNSCYLLGGLWPA